MKALFPILLLLVSAFAQTSAPTAAPATPTDDENARKARTLIEQSIQALGGQAYLNYTSRSEEGRYFTFYHGQSNSGSLPYAAFSKYPDKDRFEIIHMRTYQFLLFSIGSVPIKNKQDIVVIHNGNKGYEITYKGTAAEDPKDTASFLRRRTHSLDWVLRKWINEPGVALFYEGPGVAAGKPVDQVTVMNTQNESVTLSLEQGSHLPIKTSYSWRDPADKMRNVEEIVYDNYKPEDGIVTAHSVTRYFNGDMSYQRFMNTVKYNQNLPDTFFDASVSYNPMEAPQKKR
jgi:hypothetical protein